jgi:hypothetical protein
MINIGNVKFEIIDPTNFEIISETLRDALYPSPSELPTPLTGENLNKEPEMPLPFDLAEKVLAIIEEAATPMKEETVNDEVGDAFKTRGAARRDPSTKKPAWPEADPADPNNPRWKPMPDIVPLNGIEPTPIGSGSTGHVINENWVEGKANNMALEYAKAQGSSEAEFDTLKQIYTDIYMERFEARKEVRYIGQGRTPYIVYGGITDSATQAPGESRTVHGEARARMDLITTS